MTVSSDDVPEGAWRQSSSATRPGVEVAILGDRILLRDADNREAPVLEFTRAEWAAFLGGVRDGEFDLA